MKITPRSEQEFKSRNLIDPGTYDFTVEHAIEKISKHSNEPMIELIIKVLDMNGREHKLFDYLLDKEPMDYKIRHIYDCAGKIEKYESGNIDANDLHSVTGKVKIIIRKDKSGKYPDRNSVQDYISVKNKTIDFIDDPLPF
jgi:hypothetical protein